MHALYAVSQIMLETSQIEGCLLHLHCATTGDVTLAVVLALCVFPLVIEKTQEYCYTTIVQSKAHGVSRVAVLFIHLHVEKAATYKSKSACK